MNKTLKLFKKNEQTLDKLEEDIKQLKINLFSEKTSKRKKRHQPKKQQKTYSPKQSETYKKTKIRTHEKEKLKRKAKFQM